MLMSMSTSAFAATTTSKECKIDLTSIAIPANITVKQTVTFKDGKIIEQGNHDTLLAKKGFYADLYESQFVQS